jgi:hypothetical protein
LKTERGSPRRRPRTVERRPTSEQLAARASAARYVGSPEHKNRPSPAGAVPRPRADASICPLTTAEEFARAQDWLREAIRTGRVRAPFENDWPRYAYHREGQTVYETRLVNRVKGEYKGCPIEPEELPPGILP